MGALFWIAVLAALAVLGALAYMTAAPRLQKDALKSSAWDDFRAVAEEVGGLQCVLTDDGWPRLTGIVQGVAVEIDYENYVSQTLNGMLGLRCRIPEAESAPSAAIWIGDVDALRTQYGRPRPAGDSAGLFDVYTRVEPSASDWWQDPALHEALASLAGAGLLLDEGKLTVIFERLDAHSIRIAMRVPALVREGASRVTLH
jgi:hypothetical protein